MSLPPLNTYHVGDNLEFMRQLPASSIDLVVTDPPFATQSKRASNLRSYSDVWSWSADCDTWYVELPKELKALIDLTRDAHSGSMASFLCFMAIRLLEIRRVLKDTGALFLHCDSNANSYLRLCLDILFGMNGFRNEIAWCYGGRGMAKRWFNRKHDTLYYYSNPKHEFRHMQARRPISDVDKHRYDKTDADGRRYLTRPNKGGKVDITYYKDEGVVLEDWWIMPFLRGNSDEYVGSPDQKPIAVYERMILAASDTGDIVLDPFAGSGTTLVAADKHFRKWIGVDIDSVARDLAISRLPQDAFASGNFYLV